MSQKTIYIIIGIVAVIIFVLLYQKSQNDKAKQLAAQQALLAQQPNTQFGANAGWFGLANSLLQGFGAGVGSNIGKPKEGE